jgi:hypothetical protein
VLDNQEVFFVHSINFYSPIMSPNRGWNPVRGFDSGPLPPGISQGSFPFHDQRMDSRWGHAGWNPVRGFDTGPMPPGVGQGQPANFRHSLHQPAYWAAFGVQATNQPLVNVPWNIQSNPQSQVQSQLTVSHFPVPVISTPSLGSTDALALLPGANINNPHGGTGCPHGYSYIYPKENTFIHVIKASLPPWQAPAFTVFDIHKALVPADISVKDFLDGMGARNQAPEKNVVYEVTQDTAGMWRRGIKLDGGMKDVKKGKKVSEVGWDKSRTGRNVNGERDVVWVWITKD